MVSAGISTYARYHNIATNIDWYPVTTALRVYTRTLMLMLMFYLRCHHGYGLIHMSCEHSVMYTLNFAGHVLYTALLATFYYGCITAHKTNTLV